MRLKKIVPLALICLSLAACKTPEEKAQEFYERGLALIEEGDPARAQIEFKNAVRESNTMLDAHLALARLYEADGRQRPAFRSYLRVIEQDPSNVEAMISLSEIAFMSQEWEVFERYSTPAIEAALNDPAVQALDIATRYRQAVLDDDTPARSALIEEAAALAEQLPENELLRQVLIDGYIFQEELGKALSELDKAIDERPKDRNFYTAKIQILGRLQDVDGLEAELRRMVEVFPKDTAVQANLMRFLISQNKIDEAEGFLRDRVAADVGNDEKLVDLVRFLLSVRGTDEALKELDAAIADQPDALTLRALRASLDYDTGRTGEAIAEMERILASAGDDNVTPEVLNIKVTLATMLLSDGNEVGARRLVEEVLQTDPNSVGALKMQARWLIEEDDTDAAISAMRTALASAEQDAEAMTIMAEAYQRAGKSDLMMNFLSLAAEATNNAPPEALRLASALRADRKLLQAEAALISALRQQPSNLEVLVFLGQIYFELDDLARARQVAETLERLEAPEAEAAATQIRLQLLEAEAGTDEVLEYLNTLADENDEDDRFKLALIQTKLRNDETEEALALSAELVAENPENPSFAYFNALALASAGQFDTATAELTALTERAPQFETAWMQLIRLTAAQSSPDDTLQLIDRALENNPQSGMLLWAKASSLQNSNDIEGAIEIYETLYEQNSSSIIVANNLASLLATFRTDEESLTRAEVIARRLSGTDVPAFQDTYGWILFRNGKPAEALQYLEPAAAALTEDASVQYHLGMAYDALGRKEDALTQMRKAIEKVGPLGSASLSDSISAKISELEAASDN
ncbi:tetratricopeptide repeat protein [Roseobacter sp. A03A-229]